MAIAELTTKVELFLEASGLPNLDVGSKTDAFAVIEMKGATVGFGSRSGPHTLPQFALSGFQASL
jgi:hypothetical protein